MGTPIFRDQNDLGIRGIPHFLQPFTPFAWHGIHNAQETGRCIKQRQLPSAL
jgi:hypothetical protein